LSPCLQPRLQWTVDTARLAAPLANAYLSHYGARTFEDSGFNSRFQDPWDHQRCLVIKHVVEAMLLPKFIAEAKEELLKKSQVGGGWCGCGCGHVRECVCGCAVGSVWVCVCGVCLWGAWVEVCGHLCVCRCGLLGRVVGC
jgi:hypothetical protein